MSSKMGTPQPKFPLDAHCSIVHENTLYVYSPAGFQSLKLEEGAQWEVLPMDVSLTGAQCVRAVPNGDASAAKLYVVGGSVNATAASWEYPGLMHYSFSDKKWDWVRPQSWNTQNRQNHAAIYLQDSQKIFVYSGSQTPGDLGPSSQSFLFSTIPPYTVQSLESAGAPPSVKPMLMSTDANSALLVGGGATNTAVWKFSEAEGWRNLGVTLQQPIVNQDAVQCTVVAGNDGSVMMEKFNLGVTPNTVDQILLLNKGGVPATHGSTLAARVKRVTVSGWPTYNATFAPKSLRAGYSLAQGDNGLTVASGGNSNDPIAIFDAKSNAWVNTTQFFGGQQVIQQSASTSSLSPTSTASTSASSSATSDASAVAAVPPNNKGKMLTVLGATLGTIFGMAAFLILILICLKYRKNKGKGNQNYMEKDRMSFADRGAEFMKEAGGAVVTYHPQLGNDSHSSLAIIQGRGGNGHKRNTASDASTAGLVKKTSPLGYSDPVELSKFDLKPEHANEKIVRQNSGRTPPVKTTLGARSSGWSRYFANNEATNLASVQPDRSTYASDRTSTASQSQYTNPRGYSQNHAPQIAPLEIPKFDGQRISRVASGSPTLGTPNGILPHQVQPMQAELARANSNGSMRSDISREDHHFRKPVESWTPVGDDHRTSSNYTGSMVIEPHKYEVASSYYADGTDSFYAKSKLSSFYPGQGQTPAMPETRDSTATMFPSSNGSAAAAADSKNTFSSMYPSPPRIGESQDRGSTVTVFPGGPQGGQSQALPSPKFNPFYAPPRIGHDSTVTMFPGPGPAQEGPKKGQSDMSWLNLGTSR